jgi:signal transduction histidine kinase
VDVRRHSAAVEALVFRTVQEAIVNVRKHAEATRLRIHVHETAGPISGRIEDDGRGFDAAHALDRSKMRLHLGLDALMERIRLAGGDVALTSVPGDGTTLQFTVPTAND